MLKFSSSSNRVVNSKKAIAECLENALVDEESIDCDLVVIYTSIGHNLNDIISEAHKPTPSAQVVGCTCSGIGIPEDLDYNNSHSLGLQLVTTLVKQIHGNIEFDRGNGTKFVIAFKE